MYSISVTQSGPSEEELFLRGEKNVLMDRRRGEEEQRWEERLQENWENCVVRGSLTTMMDCTMKCMSFQQHILFRSACKVFLHAFAEAKPILPRPGEPIPAGELQQDSAQADTSGVPAAGGQCAEGPEFYPTAKVHLPQCSGNCRKASQ